MRIAMIGTGYVGLVTGALLSDRGNEVTCVDKNPAIVEKLRGGGIHIYEPGLKDIVQRNVEQRNLRFTNSLAEGMKDAAIIMLAVGTPSSEDGAFDLQYLEAAARDVGKALRDEKGFKVVVVKSTVPQGTHKAVSDIIDAELQGAENVSWAYVSNPETLAEGSAVRDFERPDRIIIGTDSDEAFEVMKEMYHPFVIQKGRIMRGSPADAELAKLFSNTALAARIAMVNEFARVADKTEGADMTIIRAMVCEDGRIGHSFMYSSPGYGGSCFPKDVQGLVDRSRLDGYDPEMLSVIHSSNEHHKRYVADRILSIIGEGSRVAVWGLTFKPKTDDMRDSPAIPVIKRLIEAGVSVVAFDPQDIKARELFGDDVSFADSQYGAVHDADALVLLTEWKQFDAPDFVRLKELMKGNKLFDFRNRWLPEAANRQGFDYIGMGREHLSE